MNKLISKVVLAFAVLGSLCTAQTIIHDATTRHDKLSASNLTDRRAQMRKAERTPNASFDTSLTDAVGNDWGFALGTAGGVQASASAAFYKNNPSPSCVDFVVVPINVTPAVGGQANLIGLNKLYNGSGTGNGCSGTAPNTLFGYAVGSFGLGSPTLSLDGKKIAVIEQSNPAKLHIITITQAGSLTSAVAPTETVIDYTAGGGTCPLNHATADASDFPYVDYSTGNGFVVDDNGRIYHIANIFGASPAVDYCINTAAGNLGSPVEANIGGTDYVYAVANGSNLVRVTNTGTSFTGTLNKVISGTSGAINEPPFVTDHFVYGVAEADSTNSNSIVWQTNLNGIIQSTISLGPVLTKPIYFGDFDNNFALGGETGTNATGYVAGYPSGSSGAPVLDGFQFNGTTGVMNSTFLFSGNTNISSQLGATCAGNGEWFDSGNSHDNLIVSCGDGSTTAGKTTNFNITSPINASTAPTYSVAVPIGGGTGLVFDTNPTGSQIGGNTKNLTNLYIGARGKASQCGGTVYCFFKYQVYGLN